MTSVLNRPDPAALDAERGADRPSAPADRKVRERIEYFDYLRVFATVGVVLIHSSNQVYASTIGGGPSHLGEFTLAASGQALGRFAVGCFFMISGALLLDPRRRFRLGHHLARVGVPLLVWSGVYFAIDSWWDAGGQPVINGSDHTSSVSDAVHALLSSSVSYQFWFVYALIACYLALPLLRPVTALPEPRAKRLIEYALTVWAVVYIVIPTVNHYWPGAIGIYSDGLPSLPSRYLGFVLLGYYLHRYGLQIRGWRPGRGALVTMTSLSLAAIVVLNLGDKVGGSTSTWAQGNPTPQVVLFAAGVFLLAKDLLNRPGRTFGFVALASRLSFRVYLVHVLILFWLQRMSPVKDLYQSAPALSIVVVATVTLTAAFGIAWALEKVTPLRRWI